jgi:hypothetical protein
VNRALQRFAEAIEHDAETARARRAAALVLPSLARQQARLPGKVLHFWKRPAWYVTDQAKENRAIWLLRDAGVLK